MNENQEQLEQELEAYIQAFSAELCEDAGQIQLPEGLRAKALLERYELVSECDTSEKPKVAKRVSFFQKSAVQFASCAACFMLIFFGYYKAASFIGGNGQSESLGILESEAGTTSFRSAPMQVDTPSDYSMLRGHIMQFQQLEAAYFESEMDGATPSEGLPNPPTAGGGAMDKLENFTNQFAADAGGVYQTNTQIAGIGESDIVKTDGSYIYHARYDSSQGNSEVAIVKEATLEKVADFAIEDAYSTELYIDATRLVVVSTGTEDASYEEVTLGEVAPVADQSSAPQVGTTIVPKYYGDTALDRSVVNISVYDIANPEDPTLLDGFSQNGSYISSRLKDGVLYLVTQKDSYGNFAVDSTPASQMIPWISKDGKKELLAPEQIAISPYMNGVNYGVVTACTLSDMSTATTAVLGMTDQIMMSNESLFLSSTLWNHAVRNSNVQTGVLAFDVSKGGLEYRGDCLVPGQIDNSFSLDEHNGILRVATTNQVDGETANGIYLYNKEMQLVGSLKDMAPGERIYSVRFQGDTAYLVTFKQVDPLFVVDLSDPNKPVVKGELKIPGFSEYLHPIGDGKLIGLGQNTRINQYGGVITDGIKLSLFDVSNPTDPRELYHTVLGNSGSQSEALSNHKAFMYYPEKKLIGFPATLYTKKGDRNEMSFTGYLVFEIGKDGFNLKGSIPSEEADSGLWRFDEDHSIQRGIYVKNNLTTISNGRLMKYSLSDYRKLMEIEY